MQITEHQAKYFAHVLSLREPEGVGRLSQSLFDAQVDLNPHQIEASLFALQSPLSKGVILADEVGLGKSIEAGLILCQLWAEKKRRILIVCPASIREQWALELTEKFHLPARMINTPVYRKLRKDGNPRPFDAKEILICSYSFASLHQDEIRSIPLDLAVIDEAHKLRNCYRPANKTGQRIRYALEPRKKVLLTATPLQNSLLEIYGLSTLIDENLFGEKTAFSSQYMRAGADLEPLRQRLRHFCKRTLRRDVSEYINYTERRALTHPFEPTDQEQAFYDAVSVFIQRGDLYCLPESRRHLLVLILRKLLASSVEAIIGTLQSQQLQEELKEQIESRLADTRKSLLEHFDEDVHDRLRLELAETELRLEVRSPPVSRPSIWIDSRRLRSATERPASISPSSATTAISGEPLSRSTDGPTTRSVGPRTISPASRLKLERFATNSASPRPWRTNIASRKRSSAQRSGNGAPDARSTTSRTRSSAAATS